MIFTLLSLVDEYKIDAPLTNECYCSVLEIDVPIVKIQRAKS